MLHEGFLGKLYYRFWQTNNENSAIASVFAIHGLGGHCKWFDNAAILFNKSNIDFFSFDLPGFGQSKYPKGTVDSYYMWTDTTKEILQRFLVDFKVKSPVFILGHSMGALISILLSKTVRANGWILSVPGFEGSKHCFPSSFVLPVMLKAILGSKENIVLPYGPEVLTRNIDTQLKVKSDPLRIVNVNADIYKHVYFLALKAKNSSSFLVNPVMLIAAGEDMVCSHSAIERFFNEIKIKDKSMKIYTGFFHDLFIEDELEQVIEDLTKWIKVHV